MDKQGKILLVEDDSALAESVQVVLESRGHEVVGTGDGERGLALAISDGFDAVLTDFRMPGVGGMQLLASLQEAKPRLPVVMMTAYSTTDLAIKAVKNGAFDYLIKPFEMPDLLAVIDRAIESHRLSAKPVAFGDHESSGGEDLIIGRSRVMQEVFADIGRVADKPVTVLVQGETGSGKELVARALFQHSHRAEKPFIAVNCAAIPANLIESELFGHERGAFTHAVAQRIGRFEQANGGTLFLDEIGDLPAETQVKLLRVLQEQVINRVGGKESIRIDVRIISATHQNLGELMESGRFREDLFYRLNAAVIQLPPLRDRHEDIPPLAEYFAGKYAREFKMEPVGFQPQALEALTKFGWPGNVRQLENVVKRALIEGQGYPITAKVIQECLSVAVVPANRGADGGHRDGFAAHIAQRLEAARRGDIDNAFETLLEDLERELYKQAVVSTHGNQTTMSKWLGVSRLTVREKLDKYELFPKRSTADS